jgi:uncharacterized protein YcgI (DUF1989 family)
MDSPARVFHDIHRIPPRRGVAAKVLRGRSVTIINTHGKQVVDTWAFNANDSAEHLSMEHSRVAILRLVPVVGDTLVSNCRNPILTITADTSSGSHDTLIAACDVYRYRQLGAIEYHDNCTDNLRHALDTLGMSTPSIPSPLNLFMNVPVGSDGSLRIQSPTSEAGQYVTMKAEMDLIIAFSACPQDLVPVNDMTPVEAHFCID